MATIGGNNLTLVDLLKMQAPDGGLLPVAEVLHQTNPILDDIPWVEGNLPTGNRSAARTSLGTVYRRKLNEGIPSSKATTVQMDDDTELLERWSVVDTELVRLGGNEAAVRMKEATASIEAIGQQCVGDLLYGNVLTTPEGINGFLTRYGDPAGDYSDNMIDGGAASGQTDCCSMLLVGWGENTAHGIYPKGTMGGLQRTDFGRDAITMATSIDGSASGESGYMEAFREKFCWHVGLTIEDWRYVARVHSIDVGDTIAGSGNNADVLDLAIDAYHRIPNMDACRPVWYVPRQVGIFLHKQAVAKQHSAGPVSIETVNGRPVTHLNGIPVRITDQMLLSETSLN